MRHPTAGDVDWWRVEATVRRVNRVAHRWPFGDTCLRRCLVAGHLLVGLSPVLVIGVRRSDEGFAAHAWLSIAGQSIDPDSVSYSTFAID